MLTCPVRRFARKASADPGPASPAGVRQPDRSRVGRRRTHFREPESPNVVIAGNPSLDRGAPHASHPVSQMRTAIRLPHRSGVAPSGGAPTRAGSLRADQDRDIRGPERRVAVAAASRSAPPPPPGLTVSAAMHRNVLTDGKTAHVCRMRRATKVRVRHHPGACSSTSSRSTNGCNIAKSVVGGTTGRRTRVHHAEPRGEARAGLAGLRRTPTG